MRAVLTVEMDGAAFEDSLAEELARILGSAAGKLNSLTAEPGWSLGLYDSNGNRAGELRIEDDGEAQSHAALCPHRVSGPCDCRE